MAGGVIACPRQHLIRRHGPSNPEALGAFAPQLQQLCSLFGCLHAFCHHMSPEGPCQRNDGADQCQIVCVLEDALNERLILNPAVAAMRRADSRALAGTYAVLAHSPYG